MGLGNLNLVEDFGDDFVGADVVRFGFVCHADAVAQDVVADGDDVFGDDVTALTQEGVCACGAGQGDGGTGRSAEGDDAF